MYHTIHNSSCDGKRFQWSALMKVTRNSWNVNETCLKLSNRLHYHQLVTCLSLHTINQSIKFPCRQYPRRSRAQWHDSQMGVQQQNQWSSSITSMGHLACWCQWRKTKSKRCVFRCFLMVATELSECTDSGRLFQSKGAQEWKVLAPVFVFTLETDRLIPLLDLSERGSSDAASME